MGLACAVQLLEPFRLRFQHFRKRLVLSVGNGELLGERLGLFYKRALVFRELKARLRRLHFTRIHIPRTENVSEFELRGCQTGAEDMFQGRPRPEGLVGFGALAAHLACVGIEHSGELRLQTIVRLGKQG